jgi:hypothetical protein
MEMQDNQQQKIEEMAKRFSVPVEFVELAQHARQAPNMRDKLEAFNKERVLIEQGDPEAVKRQHEKGM